MGPPVHKRRRKRDQSAVEVNAPPKILRKDHASLDSAHDTRGGKSIAATGLGPELQSHTPMQQSVSDPDPLSYAKPVTMLTSRAALFHEFRSSKKATVAADPDFENTSFTSLAGSPGRPGGPPSTARAIESEKKNLKVLLKAEADMKKAAEAKNAELAKVTGKERIKAAFEEFKKYEDDRVEKRCAEMDARLDALSIDFDDELYPYMLTAFANVLTAGIAKGMSEGLEYGVKQGEAKLDLAEIKAYNPEADDKYVAALYALKDLSSSQLKIPVYPEVRDPKDPWAYKEEILLKDAIAANVSRAEKKKKCRIVCRTHGVGSAHHARSDGVPVLVPTVVPQGIDILLADAATQTDVPEDEASPKLIRSKSLPPMYNLDWP
ncbi:hypothetical protein Tco_1336928 [Tanacetum coccineum]